jgi:hypothetical protein
VGAWQKIAKFFGSGNLFTISLLSTIIESLSWKMIFCATYCLKKACEKYSIAFRFGCRQQRNCHVNDSFQIPLDILIYT